MRARLARFVTALAVCTAAAAIGASTVGANRDRERTISLYNIHTKETVTVVYKRDGKYVPAAMERVNWALRDWRKNEPTTMDPAQRTLLQVSVEEAVIADEIFSVLMGDSVEKRKEFIQTNASDVRFLDI